MLQKIKEIKKSKLLSRSPIEELRFRQHRERLGHIEAIVDDVASPFLAEQVIRRYQHKTDYDQMAHWNCANQNLADMAINIKSSYRFPSQPELKRKKISNNMLSLARQCRDINEKNKWLLLHINEIDHKSQKKIKPPRFVLRGKELELIRKLSERYNFIEDLPKSNMRLYKLFRPQVCMDFHLKNDRSYGPIVIQLYTEACPALVFEFVRACAAGDCRRIHLPFVYSDLWVEGTMVRRRRKSDPPGDSSDCFVYDMNAYRNTKEAGILYFALQDIEVFKRGALVFSISFRPITVDDRKRFAFGKIIRGENSFHLLNGNGTKNGKPKVKILVTKVGIHAD